MPAFQPAHHSKSSPCFISVMTTLYFPVFIPLGTIFWHVFWLLSYRCRATCKSVTFSWICIQCNHGVKTSTVSLIIRRRTFNCFSMFPHIEIFSIFFDLKELCGCPCVKNAWLKYPKFTHITRWISRHSIH